MKNIENSTLSSDKTSENNIKELENTIAIKEQQIEELQAKVKFYEEQLRLSKDQKFGQSSEALTDDQLSIFNEAEKLSAQKSEEPDIEEITYNRKKGRSKTRKTYDDLPIEEIYYELPEEERVCYACENPLHEMKIVVRKELKIIPAQVKMVHHKQQVYACRHCDKVDGESMIVKADMPKPILPGSMVSPTLLSYIMYQKYGLAQPLYRQEKDFESLGIDIPRQNMASWMITCTDKWLKPIYDRMHEYLLDEAIIQADETEMNVLDEKNNKKNYMWLYVSALRGNHRIKLYEYQPSRATKHPVKFLKGFNGYLQTDGYQAYNKVPNVTTVGCLAHARRKFIDTIKAAPKESDITKSKAAEALKFFKEIYKLEKEFKKLDSETRYIQRLEKTKPLLDALKIWLDEQLLKTLPKSKLGEAIKYNLNQWDKLIQFLSDGRLEVDNNESERSIRPFVVGRKNWLFAKSPRGGSASATCYSIVETAKANDLMAFHYLSYLFEQLPNIDIKDKEVLDGLMPWSNTLPDFIRKKPKHNA